MKKAILALFGLFCALNLSASHLASGELSYRYIGDSTGIQHHYEIFLVVYRDASPGTAPGVSSGIDISSSCYSDISLNLTQVGQPYIDSLYFECVNPLTSTNVYERWAFRGSVILPGLCSDYKIEYSTCCRPAGYDNIASSLGETFYVEAFLNNFQGANNANFSILQHPRAFALNQPYVWPSTVYDVDADSLFFELAPAAGTFTGFPVVYSSGYSYQNPLGTQPGTSCTINPVTGDLMLQSSSSQKCDITYRVSEFNYDSTFNTYIQVNSRLVSKTAVFSSLFSHSVLSPEITIIDTLKTCGDTSLTVRPNFNLFFTSVEPSGTDFMILDPYNHLVPIDYVKPEQFFLDSALLSIHFLPSLEVNGVYKLITMVGSDLNTLYDLCGNAISDYDTLYFKVQGCTSVDIQENTDGRFNVFPNPVQNSFKLTGQGLSQYSIQLVDLTGRLMNADMISQSDAVIEFDLSTISAGVYILRISDQKEFYTTKIVKQ